MHLAGFMTKNLKILDIPGGCAVFLWVFLKSTFRYMAIAYLLFEDWYALALLRSGVKLKWKPTPRRGSMRGSLSGWLALRFTGKIEDCRADERRIYVKYNGHALVFNYSGNPQLVSTLVGIRDAFIEEQYKEVAVRGKTVLDIGANVGDSIIFFALRGAKSVIALEPYPFTYRTAVDNVSVNGFGARVKLLNAACLAKPGCIRIDENYQNTTRDTLKHFNSGKCVRATTLSSLVQKYKLHDAVLKIDCEGYEYEIFDGTDARVLRNFSKIILEFHYGYRTLEKKLRDSGFAVWHTPPYYVKHIDDKTNVLCGIIYAERQ